MILSSVDSRPLVNYLNCENVSMLVRVVRLATPSIIEAKDFVRHKSIEVAKKSGRYQTPFLAKLETSKARRCD